MLGSLEKWTHRGSSLDASIRIPAGSAKTREALSQYIAPPPVSLEKLLVEEGGTDTVVYRAPYSDCFPHRHHGLSRRRVPARGPPALARLAQPTPTHLGVVLLSGSRHLGAQPSPAPPRSRGLEARPSTPAILAHRPARGAAARAVGVGQAQPRRMSEMPARVGTLD